MDPRGIGPLSPRCHRGVTTGELRAPVTGDILLQLGLFGVFGFHLEEEVEGQGSANDDTTEVETDKLANQIDQGRIEN